MYRHTRTEGASVLINLFYDAPIAPDGIFDSFYNLPAISKTIKIRTFVDFVEDTTFLESQRSVLALYCNFSRAKQHLQHGLEPSCHRGAPAGAHKIHCEREQGELLCQPRTLVPFPYAQAQDLAGTLENTSYK